MPEVIQEELSKFESIERALVSKLSTYKDAELRQLMLGFVLPLLRTSREETIDAFETMQDRIEDIEDESLNGQAHKLVEKAKDALVLASQLIDAMMVKHEYVVKGAFADNVDESIKAQIAGVQLAAQDWFRGYAAFSDDNDEEEDGEDEDDEEEEAA